MSGKVVRVVETETRSVREVADVDELRIARCESSLNFQKFTECNETLKRLRARHQRQNRIVAAAKAVLDTWDENEWQEHAGDGELADAIANLRKAIS